MRRIGLLGLFATGATVALLLNSCSRQPESKIIVIQQQSGPNRPHPEVPAVEAEVQPALRSLKQELSNRNGTVGLLEHATAAADPNRQEKYDAALFEALRLVAERQYPAALTALEAARQFQDTEQVRQQIAWLKQRIDEQAAAEHTVADIRTVLQNGKPEEAARLAQAALRQYGGSDQAAQLVPLKLQADALLTAEPSDVAARQARFRQEGEIALRDGNRRAALLAFDQALQCGEDPNLRRQAEEVRAGLTRYDDCRQRAADLRRDPANLEETLDLLRQAVVAWDTPQIRQEIDECTLALQSRRDRLSVADFEVRGEVGLPQAGRTIAEELLPSFKARFDLVERAQLGKVLEELRLESSELADNPQARREVSRLAKLRYLVVGSITPLCGLTVQARLVDVRTGLVVQTAKLVVATPEELLRNLSRLATVLRMSDEQKLAWQAQQAQQKTAEVPVIAVTAPLPAPPPEAVQVVPPPVLAYTAGPLAFGGLMVEDFQRLPPPGPPALAVQIDVKREDPVRQRLLRLSLELGDNLFCRGRYAEAHRHFELALSLGSDREEIRVRWERCRARVPRPPAVVAASPLPVVGVRPPIRPRLVVFSFLVNCEPGLVPPALGDWASENLAAYFAPQYELVERGEVCWYMGRLGITMRDILYNPSARLALAQALNVRYFVYGVVRQTASFNVDTHLIDAQTGQRQGGGSIHVQDQQELKLRLSELAQQTGASPDKQAQLAQQAKDNEKAVTEARRLLRSGNYDQAAAVSRAALQHSPDNVALQAVIQQAEQRAQHVKEQARRQAETQRRQAEAEAARQRAQELARQAEAARRKAEQEVQAHGEAIRRAQAAQRQAAYERQLAQGQRAMQQGNFGQAVTLLESAVALNPTEVARRDLAQAQAKVHEATLARAAQEQARKEAEQRRQREAELAQTRQRVADERQRREAEEAARRKAQEARDQSAYARLLDQAKQLLARQQYEQALATLQSARQLRSTEEVTHLMNQAKEAQARAVAQKQDAQTHAALQKQREEEQARRQMELRAKASQAADEARKQAAKTEADKRQQQEKRRADFTRLIAQGKTALAAKRFDEAEKSFREAAVLQPGDPAASQGLQEASKARAAAPVPPPKPPPPSPPVVSSSKPVPSRPQPQPTPAKPPPASAAPGTPQSKPQPPHTVPPQPKSIKPQAPVAPPAYTQQMQAAAKFEQQQKYDEARKAYEQALRLLPEDEKARKGVAFSQHMLAGQTAHKAKRFAEAVKEYEAALKLFPGHAQATDALKRARQGKP